MPSSLLLLDPYRSALGAQALNEGILSSPVVDISRTPLGTVGGDVRRRMNMLRLALLFDELKIIQHEEQGAREKLFAEHGHHAMSWLPLKGIGFVTFSGVSGSKEPLAAIFSTNSVTSLGDLWTKSEDLLTAWQPLIVQQLLLKNYIPHASFYPAIRAYRLGLAEQEIIAAFKAIPEHMRSDLKLAVEPPKGGLPIDIAIFTALTEMLQASELATSTGCRVAHAPLVVSDSPNPEEDPVGASNHVVKLAIDELLKFNLRLPQATTIAEAMDLRSRPGAAQFRENFHSWLDYLTSGDIKSADKIRKDVRLSANVYKSVSPLKRISDVVTYVSFPVGFLSGDWVSAAGFAMGVTSLGMSKLADRWANKTKWVGWCDPVRP